MSEVAFVGDINEPTIATVIEASSSDPILTLGSISENYYGPISQIVARSVIFSLPHRVTWCTPTSAM